VLNGNNKIPTPSFLKSLYRRRKVHSIQGLRDEVLVIEGEMKKIGVDTEDIFNYDLMSLDRLPDKKGLAAGPSNLVLRAPKLTDIDDIASLQAAYEKEEVLPKGSAFSPAASRVNIANIMAKGHVLAAELDGRFVGKINISAVSLTRYQIGGVYVHPDFRGQGIAGRMAAEFASSLIKEGKGITLFVKKNNTPARKLYAALGFTVIGDYRITYY
jgi:RimJ/RimL family protein N-acetyltransferase